MARHFDIPIFDSPFYQAINKKDLFGPASMGATKEQQSLLATLENVLLSDFSQIEETIITREEPWFKIGNSILEQVQNEAKVMLEAKELLK